MATLRWSGTIANDTETDTPGVTIEGRLYCDVSRTNNTISVTGAEVWHRSTASGVFWNPRWTTDLYVNGSRRLNDNQTKGVTSGSIEDIWYDSSNATHSFSVGTGSGTFALSANWQSPDTGDASAQQSVNVSYPAADTPSVDSNSVSNITRDSAQITWTSSEGANCTFSALEIQYGLTDSYGNTKTGLPEDGSTTLTGLKSGRTYHYRVKITNGAGLVAYSTDATFKTLPSGGFLAFMT